MTSDYISERDSAKYLNIGHSTIRDLVKDDEDFPKPFVPGNRRRLYRKSELDGYMDKVRERNSPKTDAILTDAPAPPPSPPALNVTA